MNMNRYKKAIIHDVPTLYKNPAVLMFKLSPNAKKIIGATKPTASSESIVMRTIRFAGIICHKLYPTYALARI